MDTGFRSRWLCTFSFALVLGAFLGSPLAHPGAPGAPEARSSPGEPVELWFVVKITGSPVGFASETRMSGADGFRARSTLRLDMSRMGQPITMLMSSEAVDGEDGRTRSLETSLQSSMMEVKTTAILEGDTVRLRIQSTGFEQTENIPWEEGAVGAATADLRVARELRAGSRSFSYRVFDPDRRGFATMRVQRVDANPEEIDGRTQQPLAFEEYEGDDAVPLSTTWFDEDYLPFRVVFVQMGMEIVLERVTPEKMKTIDLEPDFDIIRHSTIPCEGFPTDPSAVEDVTLRLKFTRPTWKAEDFSGPNQQVVGQGEDWLELRLTRQTSQWITVSGDRLSDFLLPDRYIQSEHPEIAAAADSIRAASGAQAGWHLAVEIAKWVNAHVREKDYGRGFATALEVLRDRSGDCTEHSVLLAALLRAAGIPARPVVGLACGQNRLVGHMWVEAYVDYWRTLDALDPDTDPIRIRIRAAEDERAVDERDIVRAYSVVGGMRASVTGFTPRAER
jgi:hypothetical protein